MCHRKKWCGQKKAAGAKDMVLKNKDEGGGQGKGVDNKKRGGKGKAVVKKKEWTRKKEMVKKKKC